LLGHQWEFPDSANRRSSRCFTQPAACLFALPAIFSFFLLLLLLLIQPSY